MDCALNSAPIALPTPGAVWRLTSAGRPLFGLLSAPARDEFWHGEAGKGSWRNGERLVASRRSALPGARVPARVTGTEPSDLVFVPQPNSIALRIAMVAADEADMVATMRWGFEWDVAAAALGKVVLQVRRG